ncbi:hypothetical protein CTAYLR_007653 [Chrysophaeum taylorii]|uniref:Uncharacterized protein n=1 Tax=Chrysophaeum taylorii TaxID=2483200 RepID=A0AAD7XJH0_9STRA|nr:hypothetical protein CTAYLR_007653 [Chrysophaeum taylorii]
MARKKSAKPRSGRRGDEPGRVEPEGRRRQEKGATRAEEATEGPTKASEEEEDEEAEEAKTAAKDEEDSHVSEEEETVVLPPEAPAPRTERRMRRGDGDSRPAQSATNGLHKKKTPPTKESSKLRAALGPSKAMVANYLEKVRARSASEETATKVQNDESRIGGIALKEKGNAYFKRGDYEKAVAAYTEALTVCEPRNAELRQLRRQVLCNRSAASLGVARAAGASDASLVAASAAYDDADAVLMGDTSTKTTAEDESLRVKATVRKVEAFVAYWRAKLGKADILVATKPDDLLCARDLEPLRDRSSPVANASIDAVRGTLCNALLANSWPAPQRARAAHLLASLYPPDPKDDAYRKAETRLAKDGLLLHVEPPDDSQSAAPPEDDETPHAGGDTSTQGLPDVDEDDDQATVVTHSSSSRDLDQPRASPKIPA